MDIIRTVTSQGVWFRNRLYRSDALKALVGQRVELRFDGPAMDRALVIQGDSVIDVRLWELGNPRRIDSLPTAAGDRSANWPLKPRASD
ncbi:Mu transposase C-terminal domain-containing protein [Pseudomonas sp. RTC3]|uniref:Mu transposase C-terminal domain-containing protein n=1 Tax=Pseudomonas sp. 5C2 TaxID=3048588 RepID=UPI002AB3C9B1|nr:Mu transposase C-terminal domain-containing protein [Pseudomonas sp. 5C2]MDY7564776.1 Mu transposase C-terminal domain-containing protein [Pseudomonas sp. 5C2]MEB0064911.1 Mu transposase C-terminal domain-containing protein [Pseudomonas sp. RTC3]MEB0243753.1 Mu transposase C-terminal domain-containing protein [Pseudomonas sp. 5C2]